MLKNLKLLRNNANISQQKLSEILLVTQQSINKYENHDVEPDISTLIRIADYFNVSIDYLVGRTDNIIAVPEIQSTFELKLLKDFRMLNQDQQKCFAALIECCTETTKSE